MPADCEKADGCTKALVVSCVILEDAALYLAVGSSTPASPCPSPPALQFLTAELPGADVLKKNRRFSAGRMNETKKSVTQHVSAHCRATRLRFCSLSWYERQLVENKGGDGGGRKTDARNDQVSRAKVTGSSSSTINTNEEEGEGGDASAAPSSSSNILADPEEEEGVSFGNENVIIPGSGDGSEFGRQRGKGESSVMATLKAREGGGHTCHGHGVLERMK